MYECVIYIYFRFNRPVAAATILFLQLPTTLLSLKHINVRLVEQISVISRGQIISEHEHSVINANRPAETFEKNLNAEFAHISIHTKICRASREKRITKILRRRNITDA